MPCAVECHVHAAGEGHSPEKLALAQLGRWAASILDEGMKPEPWLQHGIQILQKECELALGQSEARVADAVRGLVLGTARTMGDDGELNRKFKQLLDQLRCATGAQAKHTADELMGDLQRMEESTEKTAGPIRVVSGLIGGPTAVVGHAVEVLKKFARIANTGLITGILHGLLDELKSFDKTIMGKRSSFNSYSNSYINRLGTAQCQRLIPHVTERHVLPPMSRPDRARALTAPFQCGTTPTLLRFSLAK